MCARTLDGKCTFVVNKEKTTFDNNSSIYAYDACISQSSGVVSDPSRGLPGHRVHTRFCGMSFACDLFQFPLPYLNLNLNWVQSWVQSLKLQSSVSRHQSQHGCRPRLSAEVVCRTVDCPPYCYSQARVGSPVGVPLAVDLLSRWLCS